MNIEENIFKKASPDFDKLLKYGFVKSKNLYSFEKVFMDNKFRAVIKVLNDGKVSGTVYDIENNDEYLPLRIETSQGAFTGEVRAEYTNILQDICDKCFTQNYFIYPQTNRITKILFEKYGDKPEFLWEKYTGTGVFRNPKSKKWYLIILNVDRSKIQKGQKGIIEAADVKLPPDKIEKLLKLPDFYPGYHMNKKSWITFILDDTVSDDIVLELIEESHKLSEKK